MFYDPDNKKITGITIHHERTLIRMHEGIIPRITPYAFYNLIYRKTSQHEVMTNKDVTGDRVTYTSMEHHIGIGARFKLGAGICIKSEAGYGVYLGSIRKPSAPNPVTGEISGTNGFGAIAKIGICYTF